jgi:hypothetical protein
MTEGAPKTAYEIAMERLRKKDAEAGIERAPVTEGQKTAIAEVRNFYEAKLAEIEVLRQSKRRGIADPAALAEHDEVYRRDRERLLAEREAKIEKIRRGGAA